MKLSNKARARVYAGAAFLDSVLGTKWRKKIDPEILSIASSESCILGQTFGNYFHGLEKLKLSPDGARLLGFREEIYVTNRDLDREWQRFFKLNKERRTKHVR